MSKQIVVLGAGMVGRAMAIDLAKDFQVTSADISRENLDLLLPFGIHTIQADLSDAAAIQELIAAADLVIGAVPDSWHSEPCRPLLKQGRTYVIFPF